MAQRRMFSKHITDSDAFTDMPPTSQLLYFYLNMEADDDGFVSNPKKVMKMLGSNEDDYKILIAKRFILTFESGVCVIKHWLIHNLIRNDRYIETKYTEEKDKLEVKENKAYTERVEINGNQMATIGKPSIGKVSIDKVNKEEEIPIWLNKKAWEAWQQHRKEKGKKLTPYTIKLQLKLLEENQKDHAQIIKNSITNGWTGLFPLKEGVKGRTPVTYQEQNDSKEVNERKKFLDGQAQGLVNNMKV